MRLFMRLSYRGAPFHGWQTQPNAPSVQQTIEQALATVTRLQVPIVGAGRTDAGVNARLMVAHLDLPDNFDMPLPQLARALNTLVGPDIAIHSFEVVADDAHARFDARRRTYRYYVNHRKSPFAYPLSWYCPNTLDYDAMNRAADKLLTVSDFTSFAKLHSDARTNICRVDTARWVKVGGDDDAWYFEIAADRFLRNMVRAVVGTLVDVGRGKITIEQFERIIAERNRCSAGTSMPGHALFLWNVEY